MNQNLELTPSEEIKRLQKIINEKNRLIDEFKSYDETRKDYLKQIKEEHEHYKNFFQILVKEIKTNQDIEKIDKNIFLKLLKRLLVEQMQQNLLNRSIFTIRQDLEKLHKQIVYILQLSLQASSAHDYIQLTSQIESAVCVIGHIREDLYPLDFIENQKKQNEYESEKKE